MDDLRRRFAALDAVTVPDLRAEIDRRSAALGSIQRMTAVVAPLRTRPRPSTTRSVDVRLAAAALLAALVAGAIAVGSGLVRLPAILPPPTESPAASPTSVTPFPSISPAPSGFAADGRAPWVLFHVGGVSEAGLQLWAMRADGSGAHVIQAGDHLAVAWSRDGTRLLVNNGHILVAEVGEGIEPLVDTLVEVPIASQWEAFDFAPDNERVVFVQKSKCATDAPASGAGTSGPVLAMFVPQSTAAPRLAETPGANCYVLSVLDLRTGERTELDETLVTDDAADERPGVLELPAWSPDGTKIAYTLVDQTLRTGGTRDLWVVNADGTNPARVELAANVSVQEPRWSPDGARISFTSETELSEDAAESAVYIVEVATGRLERVTIESDPAGRHLCCAAWLDNTSLRVEGDRWTDSDRFWLVALDSIPLEDQVLVDLTESLAAIDAAGQVVMRSAPGDPGRTFHWQPVPGQVP